VDLLEKACTTVRDEREAAKKEREAAKQALEALENTNTGLREEIVLLNDAITVQLEKSNELEVLNEKMKEAMDQLQKELELMAKYSAKHESVLKELKAQVKRKKNPNKTFLVVSL